jgi:tRNA (adenine37-N6)-methyltransferase
MNASAADTQTQTQAQTHRRFTVEAIGVVHSHYADKYAAPRQPRQEEIFGQKEGVRKAQTTIELAPHNNYEQALADLSGCDYIWLVAYFDRNLDAAQRPIWKPKVLTPRGRTKRGVFATRSPHRPNPLGISLVRLLAVKGRMLTVGDCDLLDGTPILDIKPYIPLYDSRPEARVAWLDDGGSASETHESKPRKFNLTFSEQALERLRWLDEECDGKSCDGKSCDGKTVALREYLETTLRRDPFPHPYRRIKRLSSNDASSNASSESVCEEESKRFELAMNLWRVEYVVHSGSEVSIDAVRTVWSPSMKLEFDDATNALHAAFCERFA